MSALDKEVGGLLREFLQLESFKGELVCSATTWSCDFRLLLIIPATCASGLLSSSASFIGLKSSIECRRVDSI